MTFTIIDIATIIVSVGVGVYIALIFWSKHMLKSFIVALQNQKGDGGLIFHD